MGADIKRRWLFLMSIILKGIDMPKNFPQTIVIDTEGKAYRKEGTIWAELQAIQIDRPHGRLIDGDEIATILDARTSGKACLLTKEMPTIIEAEE